MTASDDLLRRIENEPALAGLLAFPADFDIERRDPVEELRLPTGLPLEPVAGDGSGGTYFLCGKPGGERPVLYADSEGQAVLMAADLVEAVALVASYPYWRDLGYGHDAAEPEEEYAEDREERDALIALLGITPPPVEQALARLRAAAARTVPDFLPIARHEEGGSSYESAYTPYW
ncbi:hypothetical protein F8568_032880 [Actinomadura sp. LD22]|uniref:Uncharacterized protein n=1 Tax=Actinomadura physcomitrii TaxID=2650748 RepID=A0A6I4MM92_9ACTN|nr:hypothetical protein [Actinomadura physcomitrii]MWA05077.1 hypothetical protein [Actinomadura physcomitrii]